MCGKGRNKSLTIGFKGGDICKDCLKGEDWQWEPVDANNNFSPSSGFQLTWEEQNGGQVPVILELDPSSKSCDHTYNFTEKKGDVALGTCIFCEELKEVPWYSLPIEDRDLILNGDNGKYKSINDASDNPRVGEEIRKRLTSGKTAIWYPRSKDSAWNARATLGDYPSIDQVKEEYVCIGHISETDPNLIFDALQGENWSPRNEAVQMIERLGAVHTTMSPGDVIVTPDEKWIIIGSPFGFVNLKTGERTRICGKCGEEMIEKEPNTWYCPGYLEKHGDKVEARLKKKKEKSKKKTPPPKRGRSKTKNGKEGYFCWGPGRGHCGRIHRNKATAEKCVAIDNGWCHTNLQEDSDRAVYSTSDPRAVPSERNGKIHYIIEEDD
jgi:hypothetical protein